MNQSQAIIGDLMESFADLPHILMPEERRPYFDKGEAEMASARITEVDKVKRTVNFRTLVLKEMRNRFPLALLPTGNINTVARQAVALMGPDGDSKDVNLFLEKQFYWIDRVEDIRYPGKHHAPVAAHDQP